MPTLPTDSPRHALRDHYRDALDELAQDIPGGKLDKGRSKKATHVCGQTSLDLPAGQDSFELEDIVGSDEPDAPGDAGPRPTGGA